jgi:hypothetical protein
MESQKKFQESFLNAINNSNNNNQRVMSPDNRKEVNKYKDKNKELMSTNQNLSTQIVQM